MGQKCVNAIISCEIFIHIREQICPFKMGLSWWAGAYMQGVQEFLTDKSTRFSPIFFPKCFCPFLTSDSAFWVHQMLHGVKCMTCHLITKKTLGLNSLRSVINK
jgi:hypothetical protein